VRVISEDPLLVDIVTIKYDKNGTMLWSHSFPDDPARPDSEDGGSCRSIRKRLRRRARWARPRTSIACLIQVPPDYVQGDAPEWVRTYDAEASIRTGHRRRFGWLVYVTGYSQQLTDGS